MSSISHITVYIHVEHTITAMYRNCYAACLALSGHSVKHTSPLIRQIPSSIRAAVCTALVAVHNNTVPAGDIDCRVNCSARLKERK